MQFTGVFVKRLVMCSHPQDRSLNIAIKAIEIARKKEPIVIIEYPKAIEFKVTDSALSIEKSKIILTVTITKKTINKYLKTTFQ